MMCSISWPTIDSAPKDGHSVILYREESGDYVVAFWGDIEHCGGEGWHTLDARRRHTVDWFSHWHPLPALAADPTKDLTRCPLNLEDNHWICSAGFCDVCQADLRMQCGRLRRLLNGRDGFIVESGLWEKFCACVADETNLSAGKTASPGTVGKEGPAQTGAGLAEDFAELYENWQTAIKRSVEEGLAWDSMAFFCKDNAAAIMAALRAAEAHGEAVEALRPFATFGQLPGEQDIRDGLMRDRVCDWFGSSDFDRARAVLAKLDVSRGAEGE